MCASARKGLNFARVLVIGQPIWEPNPRDQFPHQIRHSETYFGIFFDVGHLFYPDNLYLHQRHQLRPFILPLDHVLTSLVTSSFTLCTSQSNPDDPSKLYVENISWQETEI